MVRLDAHSVDDFDDWRRGRAAQDADQQAVAMGLEMLNQHEGQAGIGWHRGDQVDESIQPPGRGTDSNDAHSLMQGRQCRCRTTPGRTRRGGCRRGGAPGSSSIGHGDSGCRSSEDVGGGGTRARAAHESGRFVRVCRNRQIRRVR